jgi:hypothetical protein
MITVNIPAKSTPQYYRLTTASRSIIGSRGTQFIQEKLIEISLLNQTDTELMFKYKLHNQLMKGPALIHQWAADMEELQSDLIFTTNLQGNIINVGDFEVLNEKWRTEFVPAAKRRYAASAQGLEVMLNETSKLLADKDRFIGTFAGYSGWRFFFQHWYRNHPEAAGGELLLKGFFGQSDLPLQVQSLWQQEPAGLLRLENKGVLHAEKFNRKAFARMLKDLTGTFNIDATLEVEMEENYQFENNGWLAEAEMFLTTSVAGWYSVTSAHQLKRLTANSFAAESAQMTANKGKAEKKILLQPQEN